jgi:hypothetical protein
MRQTLVTLVLSTVLVGFGTPSAAQDSRPSSGPARSTLALKWALPEGWVAKSPSSKMRALEIEVPGGLRLVVYHFGKGRGGTPKANLERWLGQIKPADGRPASEVAKRSLRLQHRLVIQTLDVSGSYVAETAPGSGEFVNEPKQRLLAAVVSGGDGPYFVKLVGPAAAIEAQAKRYYQFLASLHMGNRLGLVITPSEGWTANPPTNRMRCAQVELPGKLSLVVYFFGRGSGGGVEANFERWLGQLRGPEGQAVKGKRGKVEANGLVIHTLDATGTYLSGMPGQAKVSKENHRLLGAVVVGAGGPYFLKLVGPAAAVAKQEKAYQTFLRQGLTSLE